MPAEQDEIEVDESVKREAHDPSRRSFHQAIDSIKKRYT